MYRLDPNTTSVPCSVSQENFQIVQVIERLERAGAQTVWMVWWVGLLYTASISPIWHCQTSLFGHMKKKEKKLSPKYTHQAERTGGLFVLCLRSLFLDTDG